MNPTNPNCQPDKACQPNPSPCPAWCDGANSDRPHDDWAPDSLGRLTVTHGCEVDTAGRVAVSLTGVDTLTFGPDSSVTLNRTGPVVTLCASDFITLTCDEARKLAALLTAAADAVDTIRDEADAQQVTDVERMHQVLTDAEQQQRIVALTGPSSVLTPGKAVQR